LNQSIGAGRDGHAWSGAPATRYNLVMKSEAVLAALAAGVLGPAFDPAVPGRMLAILDGTANRRDRQRLLAVLRALDTRPGALALTGRPAAVSGRPPAAAEALVARWAASRLPPVRQLADALGPVALLAAYGWPGPARDATGYPGPLGPAPDVPRRLHPLVPDGDQELACDVVVVGSGAGGGVVAAELARAGLEVVVLEKGGHAAERDFTHQEGDAFRDLYLYGSTLTTDDLACRILAGSTLGGGTVVNYSTSFPTPPAVLAEWAAVSGVDAFVSGEVAASLDAVAARLGVTDTESRPGARDRILEQGLAQLGWQVGPLPRNVRGCPQDAGCGWCGFGCRTGAKQSTLVTYLEEAEAAGARLVTGADARRVLVEPLRGGDGPRTGRATGVEARTAAGHRLAVRARAVVAAAGAIETPALLLRSGLGGQVGRHLHLHPGTAAVGVFDEPVRWWEGTLQARWSAQLRKRLGPYAPIFETVPVHPGTAAVALPWRSAADHRALMERSANLSLVGVLGRDRGAGRVRVDRDGSPVVRWRLAAADEVRLAAGVAAAGEVLAAAGAGEVFSLQRRRPGFRPGPGAHAAWAESTRRAGFGPGRATLFSYHQMGSCRIGTDPAASAVGPDHRTHEVDGLYVADASLFPTASGVNPMLSVMALAHRAAAGIAARLG
jgi:choline dehydrogenase-like flavoprotein